MTRLFKLLRERILLRLQIFKIIIPLPPRAVVAEFFLLMLSRKAIGYPTEKAAAFDGDIFIPNFFFGTRPHALNFVFLLIDSSLRVADCVIQILNVAFLTSDI